MRRLLTRIGAGGRVLAAAVSVDITPSERVPLGCGSYDGKKWGVLSAPEVNMLALWVGEAPPLVFVSVDALYAGSVVRRTVEESLQGVPPENIIVAASHTHSAPMLDASKPALGQPDVAHMDHVVKQLEKGLKRLMAPERRRVATLAAGDALADHSVNRRQTKRVTWRWPLRFNEFRWRPDFWGRRDETITVLKVVDLEDRNLAMVWNYACHPVRFPLKGVVSTHYPGVVRERLRAENGEDMAVLFFQGFSGDIRPIAMAEPRIPPTVRHLYRRIRFGTEWLTPSWSLARYSSWAESLADVVVRAAQGVVPIDASSYSSVRWSVGRKEFYAAPGSDVTFQVVKLGRELGLVAVAAEPVVQYSGLARRLVGTRYSMPVGCADDTAGYFPTQKILRQGGYEAEGFVEPFGLGAVNPDLPRNVSRRLRQITKAF